MNVQQVEVVILRHLGHARRQRQIVGRVLEQRIARNFDLMEANVGLRRDQTYGLRIGDEMDLMPALRELQPELGGHYATAAIRRITGDADLHEGLSGCTAIG